MEFRKDSTNDPTCRAAKETVLSSMHEEGHPKLVLWANREGWSGEGGGMGAQDGGTREFL